jgi:membrane-bound lytic murein transglycosylase A
VYKSRLSRTGTWWWVGLACLILSAGCGPKTPPGPLIPVEPDALPEFSDDLDLASLRVAIERTMPRWAAAGDVDSTLAATRLLDAIERGADGDGRRVAVAVAYEVEQTRDPLLMTSYYEPELRGRSRPDAVFRYPIYAKPPNLTEEKRDGQKVVGRRLPDGSLAPYASRAEIEAGALVGRGLELAWTDDPLRLFLLHVQGSGRLRMDDGRVLPIMFAATNGRPYTALAKVLIEEGLLTREEATVPGITRVMVTLPPDRQAALMALNERYTFFRIGKGGVIGSLGVELTPGRSIAADPSLIRPGTLVYLVTDKARRFVVVQDTGAAIKGAHVDLFVGAGEAAEAFAGEARERGTLYVLTPR